MDYISNNVGSVVVDDVKIRLFRWIENSWTLAPVTVNGRYQVAVLQDHED